MLNIKDINKYKTVDDYIQLMQEGYNNFLEIIKLQGVLINQYGGKVKKHKIIDEISKFIDVNRDVHEKGKWEKLLSDAALINKMYSQYNNNPLCKIVQTDNPLEAFLIVTEKFMQYINNIISDNESYNNKLNISFLVNENELVDRKWFYMELHDILTREINFVLSSLLFHEYPNHNIKVETVIDEKEIQMAYNHFVNVQMNDMINYAVDSWKLGGRIIIKNEDTISFDIVGELDESYFLINERNESKLNKISLSIDQVIRDFGERYSKGTHITEYLYLDEFKTCCFLMEYFNLDDLMLLKYRVEGIDNNDVSVKELVRAYYTLIDKSKEFVKNRTDNINTLQNWGLLISNQELVEWLKENDLSQSNAEIIINQLTYRKGVDIFDAPLIKVGEKYLLFPNITINIDVGKLTLSLINEIDIRGTLFEEGIKKKIKLLNIKCEDLYFKDVEEYQCDLAFAIADDLYICECKAWNEFKNLNGYYNMIQKMYEAKEQLDRIANKFSDKMEFLNKSLGYEQGHIFKNIHKLVITLNLQGLIRKLEDTYFIDVSCLGKFLDREKPGIRLYGKNEKFIKFKGYKEYEGNINNFKFMTMIKNPANIEITRKNKKIGFNKFMIGEINVIIPMYIPEYAATGIVK